MSSSRKHIMLFPFPAYGHYIPLLELAKKIIPRHDVTIVISARKADEIAHRELLPPPPIRFYPLDDKLHTDLESIQSVRLILEIQDIVEPAYREFLHNLVEHKNGAPHFDFPPVDAIIADFGFSVSCKVAHENGIPFYVFSPLCAMIFSQTLLVAEDSPTLPDEAFVNGDFKPNNAKPDEIMPLPEAIKEMSLLTQSRIKFASGFLLNSFQELEPIAMELLKKAELAKRIPARFVGPLIPEDTENHGETIFKNNIKKWLDLQKERSVVYFSFGSIASTSAEQIAEIAKALTSLKRPFIWALRSFLQEHLPENVKVTTSDNFDLESPYLIINWAPQKKILAHSSTGVFVSHCGWNSTLEAVSYGVPVTAWPMFGDQVFNADTLAKLGVGAQFANIAMFDSRVVPAEEIREIIKKVGGWHGEEDNLKCFEKAQELKKAADEARSRAMKDLQLTLDAI